jgi:hypothetical protein
MPSSTLDTEIVIDRPPEIIKAVFMDWPLYPLLNPFITSLSLSKGDVDLIHSVETEAVMEEPFDVLNSKCNIEK